MSASPEKVKNFADSLKQWFEASDNKTNDLDGDFTQDNESYPTAKATKEAIADAVSDKANISDIPTSTNELLNNSGFLTAADIEGKANSADLAAVATSGSYIDLSDQPTIQTLNGVVTVEKQTTPDESIYASTYVIKQGGSQVGVKINIPKDLLLKSARSKIVGADPTDTEAAHNLQTGDTYLEFIANTVDNDNAQAPLIIPLKGLFEVQTADELTLTLQNGVFSVKAGGIGTTELSQEVNTILGYANDYNNSPAKTITSQNITDWNAKPTTQEVEDTIDNEMDDLLDALTAAFNE